MFEKPSTPTWLKNLLALGQVKKRSSDTGKHAYRTSFYRYLWALVFIFIYFLLVVYRLNGDDSGSSDNSGIYKLLVGAVIFAFLGAFFAPRLNERLEALTPSGRRRKHDQDMGRSDKKSSSSTHQQAARSSSSKRPSTSQEQASDPTSSEQD
jgi:hypothetical protein